MMISPETYKDEQIHKSYDELIIERKRLLQEIEDFEQNPNDLGYVKPSKDVIYQMNLEYMSELCKLISEKYRHEKYKKA